MNNPLIKPLLLVALVLVLPLMLLALRGESFSSLVDRWQANPPEHWQMFVVVSAVLASDVFLPVPSGPISTLAGNQLGWLTGTAASTLGMTVGGVLAFGMARRWGWPLAERLTAKGQLDNMTHATSQQGGWMVLLTRPLPVLAEACVLLVGALQMRWRVFLPALFASNLVVAGIYSALGQSAGQRGWLPAAVCISIALPGLVAWWWKRALGLRNERL
ncbi:TVP38/TMEM64 family protein [Bythopirellula goksoeyrii]|uniref:SNARE associated Golgi protein n=1 Tax=Bythopirellula goksoeyrii TaxID=1400387 RepID=A0A5B9QIJ9_9BACT|nr:VTT domain-containing protein [Bythopirellula goksoeyrii]QEG33963.1 SNARE associated Golgi protein [Bythopirellula goksoeyrii]